MEQWVALGFLCFPIAPVASREESHANLCFFSHPVSIIFSSYMQPAEQDEWTTETSTQEHAFGWQVHRESQVQNPFDKARIQIQIFHWLG